MVLLEMSVFPLGADESVSPFVARCLEIIDQSGLDYEFGAMGTTIEGEFDEVLAVLRECVENVATDNNRVICSAKFDYRKGPGGRLAAKTSSVEQKLGKKLR